MDHSQFKVGFARLQHQFKELQTEIQLTEKRFAPDFNVFRLLSIDTDEVKTHSPLLASLLNPVGQHGQRHLFLKAFFVMCRRKFPDFPLPNGGIETATWYIETEKPFRGGRMDVVIRSPDLKYLLVIENKTREIKAKEIEIQLAKYARWLHAQQQYRERILVLLTPGGSLPSAGAAVHRVGKPSFHLMTVARNSSTEIPCFPLSYVDDIAQWLNDCLHNLQPPHLIQTLIQYQALFSGLVGRGEQAQSSQSGAVTKTGPDEQIVEFLSRWENLAIALEMTDRLPKLLGDSSAYGLQTINSKLTALFDYPENGPVVDKMLEQIEHVKDRLHRAFWKALAENMRNRLLQSKKGRFWQIEMHPDHALVLDYCGLTLYPSATNPTQLIMALTILQGHRSDLNGLYYGVRWIIRPEAISNKAVVNPSESWVLSGIQVSQKPRVAGIFELEDKLTELDFPPISDLFWLRHRPTDYRVRGQDFLARMAISKDECVDEIAQMLWDFFDEIEPYLQAANRDLAGLNPRTFGIR